MFIRIFRRSYLPQYIFFFLFALALWLPTFIDSPYIAARSPRTPLYNLFIQLTNSKLIWSLIAFIFLLSQSLIFNYILTINNIIRKTSLLGGFLYFVFMSHHVSLQHFNPALMSHFFILLCIYFLLNMYGKETALRDSFRLGFHIGLASLFYFPSIFFLILIYTTLLLYRISNWRQWFIPLFSFFTPYFFLFVYYFTTDKLFNFNSYFQDFLVKFSLNWPNNNTLSIVISIALGFIIFIAFLNVLIRNHEKSIQVRKKIILFLNFFLISLIGLLLTNAPINAFTTFLIPFSVIVVTYFNDLRKILWLDIFLTIIVILIFINIYSNACF